MRKSFNKLVNCNCCSARSCFASFMAEMKFGSISPIRWLLILLAVFVGWIFGVVFTVSIYSLNDLLCPANYQFSGNCVYAPWTGIVQDVALVFGSIIAAFFGIFLPTLIASDSRYQIAIVAYFLGVVCAIVYVVAEPQFFTMPAIVAVIAGGLTLKYISKCQLN